jgi:lysophospholipase L1-like esterase
MQSLPHSFVFGVRPRQIACFTLPFLLLCLVLDPHRAIAQTRTADAIDQATANKQQLTPKVLAVLRLKLTDWSQLGRYRDQDQKLGPPKAGEQRVVFLGDSITDFWGRRYGKFFPGKPYINRGISGQTTPQMLLRFQQDVIALQPAAVVILAGINDIAGNTGPESLEEIEANFRGMVTLAKTAHIRVVICSVLPASNFPWNPTVQPAESVKQLNAWLAVFAEQEKLSFANYYPALVGSSGGMQESLAFDKVVHPNAAGYAVMEPIVEKAIAEALGAPRP